MNIRYLLTGILAITLMTSSVFAADVDRFIVRIARNPVVVNEAVDVTVQAVDVRGEVIKDYDGDVFMEVDNTRERDVILPADGVYTYQEVDQGAKIFNKWLVFKKEGTFTLRVYEVLDPTHEGTVEVVVKGKGNDNEEDAIVVTSPGSGSTEQNSTVNVLGTSKFPNSPIEFYVDNKKSHDTITEWDGSFSSYLTKLTVGPHSLVVKITDIDEQVLAESASIPFSYKTPDLNLYKNIVITPKEPQTDDTITATVQVLDTVSAIEMMINGQTYVMDKVEDGVYNKSFKLTEVWDYPIDLNVTAGDNTRTYQKVTSVTVSASTAGITSVKQKRDAKNLNQVELSWTIKGDFASYRVMYGLASAKLDKSVLATVLNAQVTMEANKTYYAQIQGLDASGKNKGKASKIIMIEPIHDVAPPNGSTCKVDGIVISAINSGGNYYLTWPNIAGVDKYTIYKSDLPNTPIDQSTKVAETVENFFLYPFDPKAPTVKYNYYTIQATCNDGSTITVDETKKVQVWPVLNIVLILLWWLLAYGSYRFTRID